MEAQWQADRAMLRRLMQTQPTWTQRDYEQSIGRSIAWVKKMVQAPSRSATRRYERAAQSLARA